MSEPLLSSRRSSSELGGDSPEDGLLRKESKRHRKPERNGDWIKIGLGIWAGLATLGEKLFAPRIVLRSFRRVDANQDVS
jgi:hypothetical protein